MTIRQRTEKELREALNDTKSGDPTNWADCCLKAAIDELLELRKQKAAQLCAQCNTPRRAHCDLDEPGIDHESLCGLHHHEFKSARPTLSPEAQAGVREVANEAEDVRLVNVAAKLRALLPKER